MKKVRLILKANQVIDGQLYKGGTAILSGALAEGVSLKRVQLFLSTNRVEWEEIGLPEEELPPAPDFPEEEVEAGVVGDGEGESRRRGRRKVTG